MGTTGNKVKQGPMQNMAQLATLKSCEPELGPAGYEVTPTQHAERGEGTTETGLTESPAALPPRPADSAGEPEIAVEMSKNLIH